MSTQTPSAKLTAGLEDKDIPEMDALIRPFTSLSDLLSSPSVLSSETSLLISELTSLCHASHSTFLLLHDTSKTLDTSFSSLSSSIDSLLSTIPSLHTSTQNFTQSTKPILEERRKASLILDQQEKLLDLLEIPTLIDTCARNGLYQDAMELWTHASTLLQQFKATGGEVEKLGILRSLEKEIEGSIRLMLGALIDSLRGPAKLPALHRVVGFLRSMSGWREDELAILFLSCRGSYIEGLHNLNEVTHSGTGPRDGRDDTAKYLRSYIEVFREGIYDVVTAYTAIFIDHHSAHSPSTELLRELRFLLATFTGGHVSVLLSTLSSHLPAIQDFTSLSSLLTPLTYCGTAFARIGLDFRPLLSAPFEQAVFSNVKAAMEEATKTFIGSILDNEKANIKASSWLVPSTSTNHANRTSLPTIPDSLELEQPTATHFPPPQVLTFSPPLATLLNAHLTTFNSLRLLPILSLLPSIYALLCKSLSDTAAALLEYSRSMSSPASPTFRMSFERPRTSVSLDRKNSDIMSPTSGRPMSPSLQRSSTSASTRPYSPTPRQVYTGDDMAAKYEYEIAVVLTVGKAHIKLLTPFLQRGLLQGVYGGANPPLAAGSLDELNTVITEWEKWLEEQKPKGINGAGVGTVAE